MKAGKARERKRIPTSRLEYDQMQGRVFLRHIHSVRRLGYFSNSSYGVGLRSLLPLDDVEFHFVTFL